MIRRLNKLFAILFIVGVSLYFVLLNRENITIYLSPSRSLTTSAGVILIAVFCLGLLMSALVATLFGVKAYLRERGLLNRERQRESFFRDFAEARSFSAAGEWEKAKRLWEQIVRRNPSNGIARIELSRALEHTGNVREALRILEAARAQDSSNLELLLRTASLNAGSGNKTAAIDNLALALYHHPVASAASLARDLSEDLERFEDAIEYQQRYEKLGGTMPSLNDHPTPRLMLKQALKEHRDNHEVLRERLKELSRSFPQFAATFHQLAQLEVKNGDIDGAAQYLVKAAQLTPFPSERRHFWLEAMRLWTSHGMPDRAIASARTAVKGSKDTGRVQAEVDLIELYVVLGLFEEAMRHVEGLVEIVRTPGGETSSELSDRVLLLHVYCLLGTGKAQEATQVIKQYAHFERQFPGKPDIRRPSSQNPPSPTLSTP